MIFFTIFKNSNLGYDAEEENIPAFSTNSCVKFLQEPNKRYSISPPNKNKKEATHRLKTYFEGFGFISCMKQLFKQKDIALNVIRPLVNKEAIEAAELRKEFEVSAVQQK